jgi:ankyrin repeat protein
MKRILRGLSASLAGAWLFSVVLGAAVAPVADAAMRGDKDAVRTLLKQGADVNQAQGDGSTALHWAATAGDAELVEMLLYAGANVRATTRLGAYMPLHAASQAGHAGVIEALSKGGADVNVATTTGATPLMLAAGSGKIEAVRTLLDRGADVNARDKANEETALMFAAALDRADVVKVLASRGANVALTAKVIDRGNGPQAPGDIALQEASRGGGRSQNNAAAGGRGGARPANDVPGVTRPYTYNELIGKVGGLTALHFAARQGSASAAAALVEAGADVNQVSPADLASPLLIATVNGQFDIATYLLDKGANPNLASDAGATALYAAVNVHWAPKSFYPQPRAHLQQRASYLDLMKALLDKGADANARVQRKIWYTSYNFDNLRIDESGATPFWRAAYASDLDAMKLLVSYGADPQIRTIKSFGRNFRDDGTREGGETVPQALPAGSPSITPLMAAAGAGYGEGYAGNAHRFAPTGMLAAVKYLVEELHADVNAVDADGTTAMHHAAARGDNEMILYLVNKGADVTIVNRRGQSTADMANGPVQRIQPFPDTLSLLEKLGAKNNHKCVSC